MVVFSREKRLEGKEKVAPLFNNDTHNVKRWCQQKSERGQRGEKSETK